MTEYRFILEKMYGQMRRVMPPYWLFNPEQPAGMARAASSARPENTAFRMAEALANSPSDSS